MSDRISVPRDAAPASPGAGPSPPSGPPTRVSGVRIGVGLLLGVVVVLVLLLDGMLGRWETFRSAAPGTGLLLAALSAAAILEACALLETAGIPTHARWAALASAALLAGRAVLPALGVRPADAESGAELGLLLAVVLPAAAAIASRPRGEDGAGDAGRLRAMAGTALVLVFVHLPLALTLELRLAPPVPGMSASVPSGLVLVALVAVSCKVGDSAAYFAGRTFGRLPLCWVSPRKTVEGAVASVLAGAAVGAILGPAFGLPLHHGVAMAVLVNMAGQGGDLVESFLKRCCGAKDSGRTFGEMGGALDLLDALLLAGPAGYAYHRIVLA